MQDQARATSSRGVIAVLFAATAFATSGTVIKHLTQDYGLPPLTVASFRLIFAVLGLFIIVVSMNPRRLRIRAGDLPFFILFGIVCITVTQTCWVYAISLIDVGVATVINYTAPVWTALLAWPLLGERVDRTKLAALALTLAGIALIAQIFDARFLTLNAMGIAFAMATGPAWGIYGIMGRRALRRYDSWTILLYTFGCGTMFILPLQPLDGIRQVAAQPTVLLWMLFLAVVPSIGGYGLYTIGLRYLSATVAAILATLEPLIAMLLAWTLLGERLSWVQIAGALLVIAGVLTLQFDRSPPVAETPQPTP